MAREGVSGLFVSIMCTIYFYEFYKNAVLALGKKETLDTTIDQANGAFTTILIPKSLIVEEAKGL